MRDGTDFERGPRDAMSETNDGKHYELEVVVTNKEGLHFRPIMQFVDQAVRFSSRIRVHCAERQADGRSPMELLMLVAIAESRLRIVADGADAVDAAQSLAKLVESGFGES